MRNLDRNLVCRENDDMKTTIDLPQEVLNEVQRRASYFGREFDAALVYYLVKGLAISPGPPAGGKARIATHPQTGLPVIMCSPAAPAPWMTSEALLELQHDTQTVEDLARLGSSSGK
jgi:hypothetical protein